MKTILENWLTSGKKNFVFLGEAGSGKSEIAMNVAVELKKVTDRPVHFFDMDQTKPLFRSRDAREAIELAGVQFHYEEQFFDAPTLVGGVREQLADKDSIVVMDVGGNHQGARLIGGFSPFLNRDETEAFFIINPYRPWSKDVISIDGTLSSILKVSHIQKVSIISNPNVGPSTTAEEVISGNRKVEEMIGDYINIGYVSVMDSLQAELMATSKPPEAATASKAGGQDSQSIPILPIKLYLTSPWNAN